MATKTWTGATDGDLSVAGNWSPSGVPIAADDVVFDSTSAVNVTAGFAALAAVALNSIAIIGYRGRLGTSADFVQMRATNAWINSPSASLYILWTNATIVHVVACNSTDGRTQFAGIMSLATTGVQTGFLDLLQDPDFGTNAIATSIASMYVGSNAQVEADANVTFAGTMNIDGQVRTASSCAGTWDIAPGASVITSGSAAATTLNIDGTFEHGASADITTINGRNQGKFLRTGTAAYTIGTTTIEGSFNLDPGDRVTFSNPVTVQTKGNPIRIPSGATVTITVPYG